MHPLEETIRIQALKEPANCRAMVVAPADRTRERLRSLVEHSAFEPRTAATGGEALALMEHEHCAVVVADARLPDMDAPAFCRALRAADRPGYAYTLLLCDPEDPAAIVAGLRAGADDCLSRNAMKDELYARLESARRIACLEQSLRLAYEQNRRLARQDALTGAYNRRYLAKQLPREIERARRYGRPLSVLAFDLDHFKDVNDRYGHAAGDRVLKTVVHVAHKRLRSGIDWIARAGGEEFVVVLPETGLEGACVVAERLRDAIARETIAVEPKLDPAASALAFPVPVAIAATASFGVASVEELADLTHVTADRLLERADLSLYRSKRLGRNRVTTHASLRPTLRAVN